MTLGRRVGTETTSRSRGSDIRTAVRQQALVVAERETQGKTEGQDLRQETARETVLEKEARKINLGTRNRARDTGAGAGANRLQSWARFTKGM